MPDDSANYSLTPPSPRRTFVARMAGLIAAWPVLGRVVVGRATAAMTDSIAPPNAAARRARRRGPARGARLVRRRTRGRRVPAVDGRLPARRRGESRIRHRTHRATPGRSASAVAAAACRTRHGRSTRSGASFAALSRERRQALVRTALAGERGDALPNPLAARHVALALLAHFYDSPAATDLCYDAQIGRQQCRPLAAQRQQPVALGRRGR